MSLSEKPTKVRKLFHLDQQDTKTIQYIAKSRNISESEVVRLAIRELGLKEKIIKDPFEKIIGSVKAGKNQAVNHDEGIYGKKK